MKPHHHLGRAAAFSTPLVMLFVIGACGGEDKDYGEPLDDPQATQSALGAVINAQRLPLLTSNDGPLLAADGLSANFNLLTGAKFNKQNDTDPNARFLPVDEACVETSGSTTTYRDCAYGSAIVNGTVTIEEGRVQLSASFVSESEDTTQTTDVDADMTIDDQAIDGFMDFDLDINSDDFSVSANFDGDFSIVLEEGCAVAGELEVHATAKSAGRSISTWAKAEYAGCDTVIVR